MEETAIKMEDLATFNTTANDNSIQAIDDNIPRLDMSRRANYEVNQYKDLYLLPIDPQGEAKIDEFGRLLGGREYIIPTFTLVDRSNKLFMLATRVSKSLGIRDSTTLFNKYSALLYKISLTNKDKMDLIDRKVLPLSYKGRSINAIAASSAYKVFGAKVVKNGRKVTDDYYELEAINRGDIKGEVALDPILFDKISQGAGGLNLSKNNGSGSSNALFSGSLFSSIDGERSMNTVYSNGYFLRSAYSIAESEMYLGNTINKNRENLDNSNSGVTTPISTAAPRLPAQPQKQQATSAIFPNPTILATSGVNSTHVTPSNSNTNLDNHSSTIAVTPSDERFSFEKFQIRSKLSKMILDEENWVFSHSLACRQHDLGLLYQRGQQLNSYERNGRRDHKLTSKKNFIRDPYTGTRFIPLSTQPSVSVWRRIDNDSNINKRKKLKDGSKLEYKTILHCDGFVKDTGLANVDDSIFSDVVSEEVKKAIMNQKRLEMKSLCKRRI